VCYEPPVRSLPFFSRFFSQCPCWRVIHTDVIVTTVDGFAGAVARSCSVQPAPAFAQQCSGSPSSATPRTAVTLTVNTTGPTAQFSSGHGPGLLFATWMTIVGLVVVVLRCGSGAGRKQRHFVAALAGILSRGLDAPSGLWRGWKHWRWWWHSRRSVHHHGHRHFGLLATLNYCDGDGSVRRKSPRSTASHIHNSSSLPPAPDLLG
jgi:hypothetical protein